MSRKAEILQRLSESDRQYLNEKFKEKDEQIAKLSKDLTYEKNFWEENMEYINSLLGQILDENKRLKTQMLMIRTNQMIEELELIKINLNKLIPHQYSVDEYKEAVVRQIEFEIKKFKDMDRTQSGLKRI